MVQVNTSREPQKYGVAPTGTMAFVEQIARLPRLKIQGLMTIGPLVDDEARVRQSFADLRELRDRVLKNFVGVNNIHMQFLSMGMTDDYAIALEEGSNMVRIGRAIFSE